MSAETNPKIIEVNPTEQCVNKAKELVKQLDGFLYHEALYVIGLLKTEVEKNTKVSISPTCCVQ